MNSSTDDSILLRLQFVSRLPGQKLPQGRNSSLEKPTLDLSCIENMVVFNVSKTQFFICQHDDLPHDSSLSLFSILLEFPIFVTLAIRITCLISKQASKRLGLLKHLWNFSPLELLTLHMEVLVLNGVCVLLVVPHILFSLGCSQGIS